MLSPMLATTRPPTEPAEWVFEPKLDGWRCLVYVDKTVGRLASDQIEWLYWGVMRLASLFARALRSASPPSGSTQVKWCPRWESNPHALSGSGF